MVGIMEGMRTESLYKFFMITQVSHLPVVGEEGVLIGFLSKEKLQIEMADLSRSAMDLDKIPMEYLDLELSESLLYYFSSQSKIPVLNITGKQRETWDKPRLLAEYSRSLAKKEEEEDSVVATSEAADAKSPVQWYSELILESFSDPLFSTDVNGTMVFYNDRFELDVLSQPSFRNSVSFAERFLRNLNKDVFAAFLKANELDLSASTENGKILQTIVPNLGYMVRIITLSKNDKIIGYLYHFIEMRSRIQSQNEEGVIFPSLEEAFLNKMPLDLILKETESFYIYQSLQRNQYNVSHTAQDLGIPRSTLQNRIRFLELEKKFPKSDKEIVVPRKRKLTPTKKLEPAKKSKPVKKSTPKKTKSLTSPKIPISKKKTSKKKVKTRKKIK